METPSIAGSFPVKAHSLAFPTTSTPGCRGCCLRWVLRLRVFLVVCFVNAAFAGYAVISKAVLNNGMDAGVFILCRDLGAGALLLCAARFVAGEWRWPKTAGDQLTCIWLGVTNVYFGQYCLVTGIKYTDALTAALWIQMSPVTTYMWGLVLGVERCSTHLHSMLKTAGIALSVTGAVLATVLKSGNNDESSSGSSSSGSGPGENVLLGSVYFLMLVGPGCYFWYVQKRMLGNGYPALHVTAWGYSCGAVIMAMVVIPNTMDAQQWKFGLLDLAAIAYVVIICSSLGYFLLTWANQQAGPVIVMAFSPVQLLVAAVLQVVFFGRAPTFADYAGGAAVVAGLLCVVVGRLREESARNAGAAADPDAVPSADTTPPISPRQANAALQCNGSGDGLLA